MGDKVTINTVGGSKVSIKNQQQEVIRTVETSGGSRVSVKNQQQEVIRTVNVAPDEGAIYTVANIAYVTAQSAFITANNGNSIPAYDQSNLAIATAQSAFITANNGNSIPAFDRANLALDTANSKVSKSGDIMSGLLQFTSTTGNTAIGPIQFDNGIDVFADANSYYAQLNWNNTNFVYVDAGGGYFQTGNGTGLTVYNNQTQIDLYSNNKTWSFIGDANGTLSFPGGATISANSFANPAGTQFKSAPAGFITLTSNNLQQFFLVDEYSAVIGTNDSSNGRYWVFDQSGVITFPDGSEQSTGFTGYARDNLALSTAQSAFNAANSGSSSAAAFDQANLALNTAQSSFTVANSASGIANSYAVTVGLSSNNFAGAMANSANAYSVSVGTSGNNYAIAVGTSANNLAGLMANSANGVAATKLPLTGGTISGDLQVSGNLSIIGNTNFINTTSYIVTDPLIYIAGNNYVSDLVTIGIVANYNNGACATVHTGLIRDSGTKQYYLFKEYNKEPGSNNIIDINGNNFTIAVLNSDVKTSNLILNNANAQLFIVSAYAAANAAPGIANSYATNVGLSSNNFAGLMANSANAGYISANNFAGAMANSANAYAVTVGVGANNQAGLMANSSNGYAVTIGLSANNLSGAMANSANAYAVSVGISGNTYAASVGVNANNQAGLMANSVNGYAVSIGTSGNTYAASVGVNANNFAGTMANNANAYAFALSISGNNYATSVGTSANAFTVTVYNVANLALNTAQAAFATANAGGGASSDITARTTANLALNTAQSAFATANVASGIANSYADSVGVGANSYSTSVGTSGNAYALSIGTSSNSYASLVGTSGNAYATSVGASSNTYANTKLANTTGTFAGTLTVSGDLIATGNVTFDANTLYVDATNNRVGIGTTTPTNAQGAVFEIKSPSAWYHNSGSNGGLFSQFTPSSSGGPIFALRTDNGTPQLRLQTSGNNIVFLPGAGNVGINATNPTSNLHVIGTANITSNLILQGIDTNQFIIAAYNQANAAPGIANSYAVTVGAGANNQAGLMANSVNGYAVTIGTSGNAYTNTVATNVGTGANTYSASVGISANNQAGLMANSANAYAVSVGISDNAYALSTATSIGTSGNNYATVVGTSGNAYASLVGTSANNFAGLMANSSNGYAVSIGASANNFSGAMANSANAYTVSVGTSGNSYASLVGTSANNQAGLMANSANGVSATKLPLTGGTITGDLQISGNLSIIGNTNFINTTSYIVTDPLIYVAGNNYVSDLVTIGIVANYNNGACATVHTGLIRDSGTKQYYLFKNYDKEPGSNNIIDINGNNFTVAVLNADLQTSNLYLNNANAQLFIISAYAAANAAPGIANSYATTVGLSANNQAGSMANSSNGYAITIGNSSNAYTVSVGTSGNTYAALVGTSANAYSDLTSGAAFNKANASVQYANSGTYSAGAKQTFGPNTAFAGISIPPAGTSNPTTQASGDIWLTTGASLRYNVGGLTWIVGTLGITNSWGAGAKQTFLHNSTSAGLRISEASSTPSTVANGDMWLVTGDTRLTARLANSTVYLATNTDVELANTTAIAAYNQANAAPGIANSYATSVGTSANNQAGAMANSANAYAVTVGVGANNQAGLMANSSNAWSNTKLSLSGGTLTGNLVSNNINAVGDVITIGTFNPRGRVYVDNGTGAGGSDEGGEIQFANATQNSVLSGPISIDIYQNKLRFFETNSPNRGAFINLASALSGVGTDLLAAASATDSVARNQANAAYDKANAANVLAFNALPNTNGAIFNGTLTATSNFAADRIISTNNGNGENYKVGDDAWIGDVNIANALRIKGQQNNQQGYISFGIQDTKLLGRAGTNDLTWDGFTVWTANTDGAGSGLDADFLDGQHGTYYSTATYTNAAFAKANTALQNTSGVVFGGDLTINGNVGIRTANSSYALQVNGAFAANTKSFVIDHPLKKGMKLRYGSLEGPENGVYVRGVTTSDVIKLPDYWTELVDENSITVNLTGINSKTPSVKCVEGNTVYLNKPLFGKINCYYIVFAERKDVDKLIVEF